MSKIDETLNEVLGITAEVMPIEKPKEGIIDCLFTSISIRLKGVIIFPTPSLSNPYSDGDGIFWARRFNISIKKFMEIFSLFHFLSNLTSTCEKFPSFTLPSSE